MDENVPKRLMETYLEALEREAYDEAVAQFAEDVVYFHPLLGESIRGRDAMLEFFSEDRESRDDSDRTVHEFDRWVVSGDQFALLGHMEGPRGETPFLAYGEVEDGKISYYIPALLKDVW